MNRIAIITILLFLALPAGAMDWYISPSSPFVSRTIEGTQCRYLRMDSSDSGYSPALKTDKVVYTRIEYDSNIKTTGSPALITGKACSDNSSTLSCGSFLADMDGNGVDESVVLSTDITFTDVAAPVYFRAEITTSAVSPAVSILSVCGAVSGPPIASTETDPIFRAMNTEAELESQLGGLNVWTQNDGTLGGGGGGSTNITTARTTTNITIFSDTGTDSVVGSATNLLAGVMSAADKIRLDGIEAGATNDDVPESGDFGAALGLEPDGSISAGAVSIASIGATGTAGNTTFLRGDGSWSTPIGATNISQGTRTTTTVDINSSTGTSGTLAAATTSLAGVMASADKTKLDGIATGATVGLGSDPTACGAGLVATDLTQSGVLTCVADDDVPESGDFAAAAALEADGSLSANSVPKTAMSDDSVGLPEIDDAACGTGQILEDQGGSWVCINTPIGGGGVSTNITVTADTSTLAVLSDTGTDGTIPAATTSLAGALTASDKTKLDGIATGATVGLGSDPTACPAGQVVTDQNQSGVLTCAVDDDVPATNSITLAMMTDDSVGLAELSASGTPDDTKFLRGDNTWAAGAAGIVNLFADPDPTVSADLDMNNLDIVNPDRVGQAIYYAKNQAEAEAALARIASNYGSSQPTGATIQLACGPIAWNNFSVGSPDSGANSHSGIEIRGCGPGGLAAYDGSGAGGSTTLQASTATPMISLYSCASCKVSNLVFDGNGVATIGIDWGDTGGGFPSTQGHVENIHFQYINGPTIRTGFNQTPQTTLTKSGTTATFNTTDPHGLTAFEDVDITGASDAYYNGTKRITIVDADTFTFTIDNAAAASATGASFFSHLSSKTQVDSLSAFNIVANENKKCYEQLHSQSIGMAFTKFTCSNLAYGGSIGFDIQQGEFAMYDGYFGAKPVSSGGAPNQVFINRGGFAGRVTVRNNQTEWHAATDGTFLKDDDESNYDGATIWAPAIIDGNAVVYAGAMKFLDVQREGSYQVSNNTINNQGTPGQCATSTLSSDIDSYPQDRLMLTQFNNVESCDTVSDYPDTWNPTLTSSVILQTPVLANSTPPTNTDDCIEGSVWVDTNASTGERLHTCEIVNGVFTWVVDSSKTINAQRLATTHPIDITSIFAPFNVSSNSFKNWYAIDGAKNLCIDIYDTPASGGGTQTSDVSNPPGDGYCDTASSVKAGKTKVFSSKYDISSFMQTEAYGDYTLLTTGGDTDTVGTNYDVHCLGGARDYGDEGCQIDRRFIADTYYNAWGNLSGTLTSGAGTVNIGITGIQETGGRQAGEGKYIVFDSHASARNVTLVTAATTAIGTGGVWTLGGGDVGSAGPGWCFTSRAATHVDANNGAAVYQYYPIVAANSGANQITTSWYAQGDDLGIPYTYRSTLGAPSGTVGGRVAPCVEIKRPQFGNDYVIDSLDVIKVAGFPGTASNEPFYIPPYANHRVYSYNAIVASKLGHRNEGFAFGATNLLDGTYGQRRFFAGLTVGYNGSLANLTDGWYTGFDDGVRCTPGGCQNGIRFDYQDITNYQSLAEIDLGDTRWAAPNNDQVKVISVIDDQAFNLTVGRLVGWGMAGDPFIRSSQLNTIAELHTQLALTGTRDGTKFLRDDGSWQTVSGSGSGDSIFIEDAAITNPSGVTLAGDIGIQLPLSAGIGASGSDLVAIGFDYTSYPQIDHPNMATRECIFTTEGTGAGGFICEGTGIGLTEPLFSFPAINTNTTNWIVTSPAQIMFAGPTVARTINIPNADLTISPAGAALLDDADATTQRITLGAQTANAELDFITNNCIITNTGTPIPASCVTGGGGGSAIVFDIGDDGGNDSVSITEIATLGDVNGVFSEPTADKLLINLNADWPKADQADSLAANGTNCPAGQYPLGVNGAGASENCTVDDDTPNAGDFGDAIDLDANGAVDIDSVALGTNTTGGYADSSTEGGAATTATALAANGGNCGAGNFPLGVDASGAVENCTDVVLPSEVSAYTVSVTSPIDGTSLCTVGDSWLNEVLNKIFYCVDSATDDWFGVQLVDEP